MMNTGNTGNIEILSGNRIEILEMKLSHEDNQLVLSWKICVENTILRMTFYNVSRFRIGEVSMPLEIYGFEIIDHSQKGWEKDSAYEIRDFEDDYINFFCEYFETDEL